MSLATAAARRDSAIRDLKNKLSDVVREYSRPAIGMSGQPSAYLGERQEMLLTEMRRIEDEAAELAFLEGAALEARFDPPPPDVPPVRLEDTLLRGQYMAREVVVSVDGRPVNR
jgi:hypothetical protein